MEFQTCFKFENMMQHNAYLKAAQVGIALLALLPFIHCTDPPCRSLEGHWTNREGQSFQFQSDGKALWLVRFGSQVDTIAMDYRYDCRKQPAELDLDGFQTGPLSGKTLYGILEWNSDSSFRFDAEAGNAPAVRPTTFENDQTQKFFREQ